MLSEAVYNVTLVALFVLAGLVPALLAFISAPYGRHIRDGFGPSIRARWGWVVMEQPTVPFFLLLLILGSPDFVAWVLTAMWMLHYVDRTFLYPMRIRPRDRTMPWVVVLSGFSFQLANVYVNASWLAVHEYPDDWLSDWRFIVGALVFGLGFGVNRWADVVLRNLRSPTETGYKIPHGGLYELISCPNYFGELVMWGGWALAVWSLPALSFVLFSAANLVPRALSHHRWYLEKFPEYPKRRALIPFVL